MGINWWVVTEEIVWNRFLKSKIKSIKQNERLRKLEYIREQIIHPAYLREQINIRDNCNKKQIMVTAMKTETERISYSSGSLSPLLICHRSSPPFTLKPDLGMCLVRYAYLFVNFNSLEERIGKPTFAKEEQYLTIRFFYVCPPISRRYSQSHPGRENQ